MKKVIITIVILILIALAVYFIVPGSSSDHTPIQNPPTTSLDTRNSSFKVENIPVTLVNGISEVELASIPGAKITTRNFDNGIKHDLNNDGREDLIFIVTQDGGGSGTFFYVVVVLDTVNGLVGSNSYPLGDRIGGPILSIDEGTTTRGTMRDNVIVVNYRVRKPNEPMTTTPTVDKTVWIKLDPATLEFGEVEQNFEG